MAFIRRVRTKSGATAVQIAEYRDGRQRIVKHVGSAHTDVELGVLIEQAEQWLAGPDQRAFPFDVPKVSVATPMLAGPTEPQLFSEPTVAAGSGGPAGVLSASSSVLFDALADVYGDLGFGIVNDEVFRDLVIARIVEPTSMLDVARVLADLGRQPASYSTMRRTLARAATGSYRAQIAAACLAQARRHGDLTLVLYDVTTLHFEAEHEDDLRRVGYSKERRVDPQILVGLLVDRRGFPLEISCFEGNKAETHTILPVIASFTERHRVTDLVVVADAGMLSAANLAELDAAGLRFIVGSRSTKAPGDLASHFRWHGNDFGDGQIIDTITPRTGHAAPENNPKLKAEPVWDPHAHPRSWRAVWAFSHPRAVRERRTLALQEVRARAVVAGERAARTPRFVKTIAGSRVLDQATLERAKSLVGLKGYVTNISADVMAPDEVIASYHDLWRIEQSFRMSKTDLAARPMFVRTRDAIDAHLTVVFSALAVSRTVQDRTGLTIRKVCRELRPLRTATVAINGGVHTLPAVIPPDRQVILDAIRQGGNHALTK